MGSRGYSHPFLSDELLERANEMWLLGYRFSEFQNIRYAEWDVDVYRPVGIEDTSMVVASIRSGQSYFDAWEKALDRAEDHWAEHCKPISLEHLLSEYDG